MKISELRKKYNVPATRGGIVRLYGQSKRAQRTKVDKVFGDGLLKFTNGVIARCDCAIVYLGANGKTVLCDTRKREAKPKLPTKKEQASIVLKKMVNALSDLASNFSPGVKLAIIASDPARPEGDMSASSLGTLDVINAAVRMHEKAVVKRVEGALKND